MFQRRTVTGGRRKPGVERYPVHVQLKAHREATGLSQEDVARSLGLDRSSLSRMENGEQRIPADLLPAWVRLLGISVWRLFNERPIVAKAS